MSLASAHRALIGREHELADLRAGLADLATDRGALFLVAGDPGMGKTRLLEALVEEVGPTEVKACWGRCWETGGAAAYWPWVQVLRTCIADTAPDVLGRRLGPGAPEVAQLVPELSQLLPARGSSAPTDSPQARLRLFDSVTAFLTAVAADAGGLVVALDDLHAADEASLQLLRRLARTVDTTRLLVVAAYRDAEMRAAPERERVLASVAADGRTITLDGLDGGGVAVLLESVGGRVPTADVVTDIHRVTQGNPFFVSEIARLLLSEGRSAGVPLPEEIHALVRRRLEPAGAPVRQVLSRAAVLGQDFEFAVLRRLTGPADDLLDALTEAAELRIVNERALGSWSFAHSLLRETLYEELTPAERARFHRQAGHALEDLFGDSPGPYVSQLAHHFLAAADAGEAEKAITYCTQSAESAMAALAYEDAAAWYHRAHDTLGSQGDTDGRRRYELLLACAEAEWRSSGFGQARETYGRAMRVARALGSPELLGRAALGLSQGGGSEQWVPVLEEALTALVGDKGVLRCEVLVRLALANLVLNRGEPRTWLEQARRALDTVRQGGDPEVTWRTLWIFHRALSFDPEAFAERLAVSAELVARATELHDGERLFRSRSFRLGDLFEAGDVGAVEQELTLLTADADRLHLQYFRWVVTYMRAAAALFEGRIAEADALASLAMTIGEAVESLEVDNIFACQMLEIRRQQGRFHDMEILARSAHQQFPHEILPPFSLALALAEQGRVDDARQELIRCSTAENPETLSGSRAVSAWAYLADVTWALSDVERARGLYDLLRPHPGRHLTLAVAGASLGSTDRNLGQLATLLERWEEADSHFRSAHRMHERLGAHGWLAHGQTDHARMLVARDAPGDRRLAIELLSDARASFGEMGMRFYEQRAVSLLDQPGTSAAPQRAASFKWDSGGWVVEYDGASVRLHDTKGLHYLARLLHHPGQQFSAIDLIGEAGPIDTERARHRLTRAVRTAIERIADRHPHLGEHLRTTVRVGTMSCYSPDPRVPVTWEG